MKVFKISNTFGSPFKKATKDWKKNTYTEFLVELESGQRVFMSEKELQKLKEQK